MSVTHITTHRIIRRSPTDESQVVLKNEELQLDGRLDECVRQLKKSYLKKSGKVYGNFSDDIGEYPFSSWLKTYRDGQFNFTSFTTKLLQHLKVELDKSECILDGFIFFIEEKLENNDILTLIYVEHETGLYVDGELHIEESYYMDIHGFKLAAKVNITDWEKKNGRNYLSFLRWRGEKELTDVFSNFIGFTNKVDTAADTEVFLEAVNEFTEDMPDEHAHETKIKIVDYCLEQNQADEPVTLVELSAHIDNNAPNSFVKFVEAKPETVKPELIPDKTQLRNFMRISGRNELLSMSFASNCLGDSVIYDAETDSLTITKIPSALKAKLVKHLVHE